MDWFALKFSQGFLTQNYFTFTINQLTCFSLFNIYTDTFKHFNVETSL